MNNNPISTLVASSSERQCESLKALLATTPSLKVIAKATDTVSFLNQISSCRIDLVLLDILLGNGNISSLVMQIKVRQPQTCCILLVDTPQQLVEAMTAGAYSALIKGFHISELLRILPTNQNDIYRS